MIPPLSAEAVPSEQGGKPNVVFILTDNQGPWTLGCYGNPDIRTPNVDRLAAEGMRFTRAYASNPVCSPSRATYLTGLMPSQHGVHCFLDDKYMMGPQAYETLKEFRTLPKILAENGYVCGLTGKWHLGANLTPQEGFSYWITMVRGGTGEFYDLEVIENGEVRKEPTYATDLWTEHAIRFLRQNKDRPFFLYLPYNGPYSLGNLLLNEARNRHRDYYRDKTFPSFHRDVMHPWLYNNRQFLNNLVSIRRVAAETSGVDDGVGQVMSTLKELGLDENTLVIYAADQGWMGGMNGLWGMGDHTRPMGAFDGMMHIPMIFRHPGRISAGGTSDIMVSNYDLLPTLLAYLNLPEALDGAKPRSPGRDFSPVLLNQETEWDNRVYYEMEYVRAVRTERHKYIDRLEGPYEFYDLEQDPYEKFNLYGQPSHAKIQQEMEEDLEKFFAENSDPKYDLYHGGSSKASLLTHRSPRKAPPATR